MAKQSFPVLTITLKATGAIVANRFVTSVGAQSTADGNGIGVARTAAAIGAYCPVDVLGTAVVEAGAAITLGDTVKITTDGKVIAYATSGVKVGIALEAAAADGAFIEVLLMPNVA